MGDYDKKMLLSLAHNPSAKVIVVDDTTWVVTTDIETWKSRNLGVETVFEDS